ncbi:MAG: hypothetical protein ACRDOK_23560 [Streptosporangiaceae bacterium]
MLSLANSVDDSAWSTRHGRLFGSNTSGDTVDVVTGPFRTGTMFVAVTTCDSNSASATCPGPGFPADYLGTKNLWTGAITPVSPAGPSLEPQGMIFGR